MKKRIIAMALCLAMTLSLFPTGAFADPENEPAALSSEAVAELVQEQQPEALPEAAAETEKTENEAPAEPEKAESEASSEPAKADSEPAKASSEPAKADSEPAKADSEPAKADSEPAKADSEPTKADSEPVESEAETAEEPAEENSGSKWDALKNSIGNLFGGGAEPASIHPELKVDTYEFYVDGKKQENWTQRVAAGDTLKIPGTPKKDGYVFEGWFIGKTKLTDGTTPTVTGGKTVSVKAEFAAASSYVYFMDAEGKTVMYTAQGTSGADVEKDDISTAEAKVRLTLGGTHSVQGWSEKLGGDPLENIKFTEGTRTLFPVVKDGYWVTFDSDGGSYIAPQFGIEGKTLDLSQPQFVPTRAGYDFTGWYQGDKRVTSVTGEAAVKAKWQAQNNVQYTVIYWLENADDDGYSFDASETKTGTAGELAEVYDAPNYEGFNQTEPESKTIAGDGSTILNVYYKRNVYEVKFYNNEFICGKEEHKHNWLCRKLGCTKQEHTHTDDCRKLAHSITAKYGANISKDWPKENGSSTTWKTESGAYQANIDTMPLGGAKFYGPKTGHGSETAYYYVEALPDEPADTTVKDIGYKLHHKDTSPGTGYYVTEEDRYPITGFTLVEGISTKIGKGYDNAKFYYSRNSYNIRFYNGNKPDQTKIYKFQQSIADEGYTPEKPERMPANSKFVGWYGNELCQGDAFKFEGTMPANDITLYAKWVAPDITVTIPMKDGTNWTITVPYGSKLENSAEWKKLAAELNPDAWMIDGKIFNLDTELHKSITLTPYYKQDATPCTITYDEHGEKRNDTTKYAKGSEATILNPKYTQYSDGLKFQCWRLDDGTTYLPGQSIIVKDNVTLTAVYGEPPEGNLTLTYHNGDKTRVFEKLLANSEQIAADPAQLGDGFKATEGKKFAGWATTENGAENGAVKYPVGKKFYITKDDSNDLYAVWKDLPNISDENVATINSPQDVPYDGMEHKWTPEVKDKSGNALTKNTDYTVSYSTKDFTNVTGTITVTITGIGNYTGTVTRTYQITPVAIELTAGSDTKAYDGKPLTKNSYQITSGKFVDEQGLESVTVEGSQTQVGKSANVITDYILRDNTRAGNYTITTINGTLEVTPMTAEVVVTITGHTDTAAYDGTEKSVTGYDVTISNDLYTENDFAFDGTAVAKGTNAGTYQMGLSAEQFTNTNTKNFTNVEFVVTDGKLVITPKNIVPGENNKDLTATAPEDVVYNGKSQQKKPVVKDGNKVLEEGQDYTLTYSKDTTNVGTVTVTINGKGNYDGKFDVTYKITRAPLTVTTEGGSKVYDGKPLTAEGSISGFVNNETATFTVTGSQTEVGTSDNTYAIAWEGTAKESNYTVSATVGKLVVTAQSINPKPEKPDPEKPDEKDPAYGGVQIDSPSDSVYDGTEHKWAPTVLDKDGKALTDADYKVTYSTDNFTDATGTITVTITGTGNYTGTVTRTYKITPASLKITTNSAEKTYDGSALTAGGEIKGLVKGETATLKTTGSQTEVGESKNTYEIVWDGSAKEANYKIAEEDLGTLKVNARSGGGSSSKPTPEDEPTPTPTPTPLPTLPTTPAPTTPARRVTRSTATVTQPTSRPTEQITENETPKAESEPEVIEDEETPLAPMATGAWALVNLILMLLTVLASLLLLLGYLGKKKYAKEDEYGNALHDANGNEIIDYTRNKKGFWRVASLIPAIAAVIAFALTENMRLPMVMVDRWTLLMVIIAVVQLIVAVLCKKKKESEEDENQANA